MAESFNADINSEMVKRFYEIYANTEFHIQNMKSERSKIEQYQKMFGLYMGLKPDVQKEVQKNISKEFILNNVSKNLFKTFGNENVFTDDKVKKMYEMFKYRKTLDTDNRRLFDLHVKNQYSHISNDMKGQFKDIYQHVKDNEVRANLLMQKKAGDIKSNLVLTFNEMNKQKILSILSNPKHAQHKNYVEQVKLKTNNKINETNVVDYANRKIAEIANYNKKEPLAITYAETFGRIRKALGDVNKSIKEKLNSFFGSADLVSKYKEFAHNQKYETTKQMLDTIVQDKNTVFGDNADNKKIKINTDANIQVDVAQSLRRNFAEYILVSQTINNIELKKGNRNLTMRDLSKLAKADKIPENLKQVFNNHKREINGFLNSDLDIIVGLKKIQQSLANGILNSNLISQDVRLATLKGMEHKNYSPEINNIKDYWLKNLKKDADLGQKNGLPATFFTSFEKSIAKGFEINTELYKIKFREDKANKEALEKVRKTGHGKVLSTESRKEDIKPKKKVDDELVYKPKFGRI